MRIPVAALTALALLSAAASSSATEWRAAPPGSAFAGAPRDAARSYVAARAADLGLAGVSLAQAEILPGRAGATVRFEQRHGGLPVFDSSVAVRVLAGGRVARSTLGVARGLTIATTPAFGEADARALISSLRGAGYDGTMTIGLGVRFLGLAEPKLAYRAFVPTADGGLRYDIDALTGAVIDAQHVGKNVTGRVYKISSAVTPTPTDEELLDLDGAADRLNGFTGNLSAFEYVSGAPGQAFVVAQNTAPDVSGNFTFDPPSDPLDQHDSFAVVNAYYHTHRMRSYFTSTLGVDMTASKWSLGVTANVLQGGMALDNAAFSPTPIGAPWNKVNTIEIGQGSVSDFAYDSDVFLHEFTHYVAHNAINYSDGQLGIDSYGLNTFPGSIDEGTADYFACTVNGDPVLGEASLATFGATRDLSKDSVKCPDDIFGEVHADGEIVGSITWKVRDILGGAERADPLIWTAMTMLDKSSSLGDLATGIIAEAEDQMNSGDVTKAEVDQIKAAVAERGLDDCGRELSLDTKSRVTNLLGLDIVGQAFGADCATVRSLVSLNSLFHFTKKPGKDATGVTFKVKLAPQKSGDLKWAIYAHADAHVVFVGSQTGFPTVSAGNYKADGFTDTDGELTIDAKSDPPFDASKTYYAVIVQQNCPNASATVTAEDVTGTLGTGGSGGATSSSAAAGGSGGGGGETATTDDGGCGCRVPASDVPSAAGAAGLLLAAAALLRRRRAG